MSGLGPFLDKYSSHEADSGPKKPQSVSGIDSFGTAQTNRSTRTPSSSLSSSRCLFDSRPCHETQAPPCLLSRLA